MNKTPMAAKQIGKLDVLFILPPHFRLVGESFFNFPLGLGYLVSYLQKKHFVSAIFNMDTTKRKSLSTRIINRLNPRNKYRWYSYAKKWDVYYKTIEDINDPIWAEIEVVMRKTNPKIVGITASIINMSCAFNIAKIVKKVDPNAIVVLGGPAATTIPDYILGNEHVDYLVYGEGEETMAELTEHIFNNTTSPEALKRVRGIIFRYGGEIMKMPPRTLIPDINELPFPDRESMFDLDENNQIRNVYSNGDILTSRGCPYLCKFCAAYTIWGTRTPRTRSVENIMQEVEHIVTTYGQKSFIFWDDLFTANKKRVIEFCEELLKKDLNITWVCLARLNTLDREMLDIMKKAGCIQIQVGIESGSERILKFIGKNLAISVINEKTQIINDAAMNWLAFFIIGFPTETKEEIEQTLNYIKKIKPCAVGISIFSPYPGTEFFTFLNEKDLFYKQGEYLKNDTWYTENNYTGTMSDADFSKIALEALKFGDKYNRKLRPSVHRFSVPLCPSRGLKNLTHGFPEVRGHMGLRLKDMIRLITPPVFIHLAKRLRTARQYRVEWEYISEGWAYAETHPEVKGWNVQGVLEIYKEKWPQFVRMVQGTAPLGLAHESALTTNKDLISHNTMMSFAYSLALAARNKDRLSILDWGGGIGHYYLLSQALLPSTEIEYHCKDVPVLCEYGAQLFSEQHFYTDESCLERTYDFVMASASMHYSEDWQSLLAGLAGATQGYLYITSLPTVLRAPSFVFVQRAYAYGYNTEYLGWCLNRGQFLKCAEAAGLKLVREFVVGHHPFIYRAPEQNEYRGFLFHSTNAD